MDSYKRFRDENYKNWLKTAESLCILRSHIREFVENETETYHTSLKKELKNEICTSKCTLKTWKRGAKFPFCDKCELWKNAILKNSKKSDIHWNNSVPHLWHQDKWEVAKVYMIYGVQNHHSFEQFDLSSILNFMDHCKHFARFKKGDSMTKVISVRNKVMHSPDFRFTKNEMADGIQLVLKLAQILENHAPGLKTISEEIEKFSKVLEMYTGEDSQSGEDSKVDNVKLLDREQAALKEKLEFLTKRFEEDNPTEFKEELLGLKTFVDQNKDLLENLGPQISQINILQEKVDEHEQQITDLKDRVDQLEKDIPDPVFSGNPPKYKNYVFEEARKRKMPEPVFEEEQEAEGYRGVVEVNSKSFKGMKVWNSKIEAHQDVAKIALDFMKSNPEWTEKPSSSGDNSVLSGDPPKFKNHLFEEARKRKIADPVFREEQEANGSGFRGVVEVNGKSFKGSEVWKTKKEAHQDVAKIALDFMKFNPEGTEEPSLSGAMLSGDPPKYKNHLFEEARKRKIPDPVFTEEQEANGLGFRGVVEVNGKSFKSSAVWKTKKEAHQDVAKIALDFMKSNPAGTEELLSSGTTQSTTSTAVSNQVLSGDPPKFKNHLFEEARKRKIPDPVFTEEQEANGFRGVMEVNSKSFKGSEVWNTKKEAHQDVAKIALDFMKSNPAGTEEPSSSGTTQSTTSTAVSMLSGDPPKFKNLLFEEARKRKIADPVFTEEQEANGFRGVVEVNGKSFKGSDVWKTKKEAHQDVAKIALDFMKSNPAGTEECLSSGATQSTAVSNSVLSGDPPKFKNHLFEEARKRKISDPDFTEEQEANGFRGVVEVNGKNFKGSEVWKTKKEAHQDVAKIALDFMKSNPAGTEECSSSGTTQSTTSTAVSKIDEFLALYDLSPPNVTVESVRTEMNFSFQLHINLNKFTFQTNNSFKSKKDGVSKSYGLLGQALGILPPNTDEKQATMLVKQHFTQNSVAHPKEKFEASMCSLQDITYDLVYEGQGFTEAEAKLDALQKAHCSVPLLFGHNALPKLNSFEETEAQINNLLNMNGQKDLTFSQTPTKYKSSIQLQFSNYTMENNSKRTKKANRNQLSGRILRLLGKEPDPDSNSICKNVLDQWFTQINLQRPLFEDTKEVQGSKATFSAPMSCSHPNWEDSTETARQKLIQELKAKFKYLTE